MKLAQSAGLQHVPMEGSLKGRRLSRRLVIASCAAILKMIKGVNVELGLADGDEVAGRAMNVGGVANAFKAHFGTDRVHESHVCLVLVAVHK